MSRESMLRGATTSLKFHGDHSESEMKQELGEVTLDYFGHFCALFAERHWNMWIPGFGSDEVRPYKKSAATEAHKQVKHLSYSISVHPVCTS